jgi:hypothetical protein
MPLVCCWVLDAGMRRVAALNCLASSPGRAVQNEPRQVPLVDGSGMAAAARRPSTWARAGPFPPRNSAQAMATTRPTRTCATRA